MTRKDIQKMGIVELTTWLHELGADYPVTATVEGLRDQLERTLFINDGELKNANH